MRKVTVTVYQMGVAINSYDAYFHVWGTKLEALGNGNYGVVSVGIVENTEDGQVQTVLPSQIEFI